MTLASQDIYASPNGDVWRLVRDAVSGRLLVRHEANPSSGGHVTETAVEAFLARGGAGPEHVALRDLVGQPSVARADGAPSIRYRPRRLKSTEPDAGA